MYCLTLDDAQLYEKKLSNQLFFNFLHSRKNFNPNTFNHIQAEQMKFKDRRIKIMSEILNGIKVIIKEHYTIN